MVMMMVYSNREWIERTLAIRSILTFEFRRIRPTSVA